MLLIMFCIDSAMGLSLTAFVLIQLSMVMKVRGRLGKEGCVAGRFKAG